ncbi:MAG: PAS domain S-box protein [Chloroflexi bacterium]|nr:MAG: PAS domain S-box protein [Chloroflexota bacterium]
MTDHNKSKSHLLAEVTLLRQRVLELETAVSNHVHTQQALQETRTDLCKFKEHLEQFQKAGKIGSWELDPFSNRGILSKEFARIHGIDQLDFEMDELINLVPDEDQQIVAKALENVLEPDGVYEVEHRIIHQSSGEIFWVHARGEAIRDNNGAIIKITGTSQDITERKVAEKERRQSEEHLSVVFNNTTDLQILWAVESQNEFRVARVNKSYIKTAKNFGIDISEEQILGKTLDQVLAILGLGQDELDYIQKHYQDAATTGRQVDYTDAVDLVLGTYFSEISLVPTLDAEGKCQYILFNSHDVTNIKNKTEELRKLNEELDERVRERTADLHQTVQLMAGREVRMADLKRVIKMLRKQLQNAGMKPVADDPLIHT